MGLYSVRNVTTKLIFPLYLFLLVAIVAKVLYSATDVASLGADLLKLVLSAFLILNAFAMYGGQDDAAANLWGPLLCFIPGTVLAISFFSEYLNQYVWMVIQFRVLLAGVGCFAAGNTVWTLSRAADPMDVADSTLKAIRSHQDAGTWKPGGYTNDGTWKTDEAGKQQPVPKIIHRVWKNTDVTDGPNFFWSPWLKHFPEPEYTHMLWTDERARALIASDFPWFLPYFDSYRFDIERADAIRPFVLLKYGGLYADMDYEPLQNFWEHIPKGRPAFVESPYKYDAELQNSLFSSPPGHPLMKIMTSLMKDTHGQPVFKSTGPQFLDKVINLGKEDHLPMHVLPAENFGRGYFMKKPVKKGFYHRIGQFHRDIMYWFYPMKYFGKFDAYDKGHFARHHCTASYMPVTGLLQLNLFGGTRKAPASKSKSS